MLTVSDSDADCTGTEEIVLGAVEDWQECENILADLEGFKAYLDDLAFPTYYANSTIVGQNLSVADGQDGADISGYIFITQKRGEKARIQARVEGLYIDPTEGGPGGNHGFHIHTWGAEVSCGKDDTGGHFNPTSVQHGGRDDEIALVGALGNIEA